MDFLALYLILVLALILLISNRVTPDGVGLAVIVALVLSGQASPTEAFAGFSHPATLTVAAVLILSAGVQRTGVVDVFALWIRRHGQGSAGRLLRIQTSLSAAISAFLSNTATVAVFLPVVMSVARDRGLSASKFLIPLSFASLLGGMCTLIGTSTNIVVASLVEEHGLEPMKMFDFAPIGLVIAVLGFLYLNLIAPRIIPDRRLAGDLAESYHMRRYLTEVEIVAGSHLVDRTLEQSRLSFLYDLDVLEVHREGSKYAAEAQFLLHEGDVLITRAPLETIRRIQDTEGLRLRAEAKVDLSDLLSRGILLAEAVVPPGSPLVNRSLMQTAFRNKYGVTALALYRHGEVIRERVGRTPVAIGDVLLLRGSKGRLRELAGFPEVLSVIQILPPRPRRKLSLVSVLIVATVVLAAAAGLVSLVKAALAGAFLMVITGCLTLRETYRAVDRRTVLLLAGMVSLGLTMERTGAAEFLAHGIMDSASGMGPWMLLLATYVCTALFTEFVTNNACAVIMTPIAIAAARDFGLDPRPFVFAVAYAASASFLTPWGYQTNMFVYGPGGYKFTDFARVGFPLTVIAAAVALLLIPQLWPLAPPAP